MKLCLSMLVPYLSSTEAEAPMRYVVRGTQILVITILALGVLCSLSGAAWGVWFVTHGTAGKVQKQSVVGNPDSLYKGDGMDLSVEPGTATWVHFPIQLQLTTKIRYVGIEYSVYYEWFNRIQNVHVYDGATKVAEFNNLNWDSTNRTTKVLDMGKTIDATALNIAVSCYSHPASYGGYRFYMVGAGL